MLKHLSLEKEADEFSKNVEKGKLDEIARAKFLVLGEESLKVFKWLMSRGFVIIIFFFPLIFYPGQLENQWQVAVKEKKCDTRDFEDLPPEKLKLLCSMKDTKFSLMQLEVCFFVCFFFLLIIFL